MKNFILSQRFFMLFLFILSTAVLIVNFTLEHGFQMFPCQMCILERYPYSALLILSMISYFFPLHKIAPLVQAGIILTLLTSLGLSFYHVGLEYHFFNLPHFCGGGDPGHFENVEALKAYLSEQTQIVRCDIVLLKVLGHSLAEWNFFLSAALLGLTAYFIKNKKHDAA